MSVLRAFNQHPFPNQPKPKLPSSLGLMLFPFSSAEGASTFGVTGLVTPLRLQTGVSSFHVSLARSP